MMRMSNAFPVYFFIYTKILKGRYVKNLKTD
jgi:hypothetical protein